MKTILFAVFFSFVLFGCCSVGGSGNGNAGTVGTFRAQGTSYANGDIVNVVAKVSAEQASTVALSGTSGHVGSVLLGSENGNAVYEVTIIGTDGAKSVFHIDANSGEILKVTQ